MSPLSFGKSKNETVGNVIKAEGNKIEGKEVEAKK